MQLFREHTLLAKIETTEGTDPTPTGAANAILCGNLKVSPLVAGLADRVAAFPTFGSVPQLPVNCYLMVEFDTEGSGSGALGTAPAWGVLARACGMAETIVASTRVEYAPVSSSQESVTIYANESGTLHKLTGARGSVVFGLDKDNIPVFHWKFLGRYNAPAAQALPALTLTSWIDPLPLNKVNTPTFTLDGYSPVLESLSIDLGNKAIARDRPGAAYIALTDREMSGSVTFESPPIGTKDFFTIAKAGTQFVHQLVHGTVAGNILQFDNPKVQLQNPAYADIDGIRHIQGGLRLNRNAGDDELKLTVK